MACSSDLEERLNAAMRAADLLQQAAAAHAQELRELGRFSGKAPSMCDEPSTADLGSLEVKRPAFHSGSDSTEVAPPSQQPALLQIWRGPENDGLIGMSLGTMMGDSSAFPYTSTSSPRCGDLADGSVAQRCCAVFVPTSTARLVWDACSLVVIVWDLVVLPLSTFDIEGEPFVVAAGLVAMVFWMLDIVMSFLTAFNRPDGLLETRIGKIARRYLLSWFPLDLSMVALDVMSRLWFGSSGGSLARMGRLARFARIMKLLRMLRMARAMKMVVVFDALADSAVSRPLATAIAILRLLVEVAAAAHFIACAWVAVGKVHGERFGWLAPFSGLSSGYQYLLAFHWTVAQFTPAASRIHATNFEELLFTSCVLFFGIIIFSSVIGRVTALVAKRRQEAETQIIESESLRHLCEGRQINLTVASRVIRFLGSPIRRSKCIVEDDIACLSKMPRRLLIELRYCLYCEVLMSCPVFKVLRGVWDVFVQEVCNSAVKEVKTAVGDTVFGAFGPGAGMYFVVQGEFRYLREQVILHVEDGPCHKTSKLFGGECLSEAALWMPWTHRGLLAAVSPGTFALVPTDRFRFAAEAHQPALHLLRRYAHHFAERMRVARLRGLISDLWAPFSSDEDLTTAFLEEETGQSAAEGPQEPAGESGEVTAGEPCGTPAEKLQVPSETSADNLKSV